MKVFSSPQSRIAAVWLCLVMVLAGLHSAKASITDCGKPIMLSEVKFKDATLEEAVAYVKQAVTKLDTLGEGNINVIILGASEEQKKRKISLDIREISLRSVMDHIANAAGLKVRVDAHAIVLAPVTHSHELSTRIYRVSPDFMQKGSAVR